MGDDATIGVPTADSSGTSQARSETAPAPDVEIIDADRPEAETAVSVYVAAGTAWREKRLAPGETMEVTVPSGQPIAYVEVDADADVAGTTAGDAEGDRATGTDVDL